MTATEELRRLLDERGVEWRRTPHYSSESIDNETVFRGDGIEWYANDHLNGRLGLRAVRYEVTPAQAVDATLGRGECHDDSGAAPLFFSCSECGCCHLRNVAYVDMPRYCPKCGRKVVTDGHLCKRLHEHAS